jgi:O-antigen/teichoic acid export membrane protein
MVIKNLKKDDTYRAILRSTKLMGGASIVSIIMGIVRMKAAAVLLGPSGVGLIGLFNSLIGTAAIFTALGFDMVGTKQVAEARKNQSTNQLASVRSALVWGSVGLSILGGLVFFLFRELIATQIINEPLRAQEVGWLAIGVSLTVISGSQAALLRGYMVVGYVAKLQIAAAILATIIGIAALLIWRNTGILLFVIAGPISSFVFGYWYVSKLDPIEKKSIKFYKLVTEWQVLAKLGFAFMVSGLFTMGGHLAVRNIIQSKMGLDALGQFQASVAISTAYIAFLLTAIVADYYPRISGSINNHIIAAKVINEQIEVSLLLAGPLLVAMVTFAPQIIHLLYSTEFYSASNILRWQLFGDTLKVVTVPLGFVLIASAKGKEYVLITIVGLGIFVLGAWIGIPLIGIKAVGISYTAMYALMLICTYIACRWLICFRWKEGVVLKITAILASQIIVMIFAQISEIAAIGIGCVFTFCLGLFGYLQLVNKTK